MSSVSTYLADLRTNLYWRFIQLLINTTLYFESSAFFSPKTQPNRTKTYPGKSHLYASRIFTPANISETEKLPLVIMVHGGAFIANNPARDDPVARRLADTIDCIVVGVDYSHAPQCPFPAGYNDVVDQCLAVIYDTELPIDRERVVLAGASAGGNLVLAAAQDSRLRGKILGVLSVYPVTDIIPSTMEKMATRPDPSVPDFLESSYASVKKVYLGASKVDLKDPRVSPVYFSQRTDMPEKVYIIGAEHDLLCHEAEEMAEKLAKGSEKQTAENGWQAGGVKWELVRGQGHGFDLFGQKNENAAQKKERLEAKERLYQGMADWLKEVFGTNGKQVG